MQAIAFFDMFDYPLTPFEIWTFCGVKSELGEILEVLNGNSLPLETKYGFYFLDNRSEIVDIRQRRYNYANRKFKRALKIARFLEKHPRINSVFYPGLESHENHNIALRQMSGFGGVLSFTLNDNDFEAVSRLLPRLRYAHSAANLGAVETTVGPPATTSHVECTPEEREAMGIPESLIRYSVGIENSQDLIADLSQALG